MSEYFHFEVDDQTYESAYLATVALSAQKKLFLSELKDVLQHYLFTLQQGISCNPAHTVHLLFVFTEEYKEKWAAEYLLQGGKLVRSSDVQQNLIDFDLAGKVRIIFKNSDTSVALPCIFQISSELFAEPNAPMSDWDLRYISVASLNQAIKQISTSG